jgi:hypothetical protein
LVINLLNRGAGETLSGRRVQFDDLPAIENIGITIQRETRPQSVQLQPSLDPVNWTWQDGVLSIRVPSVRIHDIVVIT